MGKTLFIIGGNSTAIEIREIFDVFYSNEYTSIYNIIGNEESTSLTNVIHDSELVDFLENMSEIYFIIGVTNIKLKNKFRTIFEKYSGIEINCIHPQSYIAPSAQLGKGIYIAAFSVISSNAKISNGAFININVSIGHDSSIGQDCCINPGARVSGHVVINDRTLIGANAFIFQGVSVGADCAIDAMSYIRHNIQDFKMCTTRNELKIFTNRFY